MRTPVRILLVYWVPILVYVGLIFLASSLSMPIRLPPIAHADKLAHFIEYALLAFLVARAFSSRRRPASALAIFCLSLLTVGSLGGLDELYQSTVPHRSSDWLDLLADCLGGATGSGAYLLLRRMRRGSRTAGQSAST